jgi:hypothetical protein
MNEFRHIDSPNIAEDILFYINPYNKGTILSRREIDHFIDQQKLNPDVSYYIPCDNKSIILRMITNLIISFQKLGFDNKVKLLEDIIRSILKIEIKE